MTVWLNWGLAALSMVVLFTIEVVLIRNGALTEQDLDLLMSLVA